MSGWVDKWIGGWLDRWMSGWVDRWRGGERANELNEREDKCLSKQVSE